MSVEKREAIRPDYYKGKMEVWDFIAQLGMGPAFCLGSVIKYVSRYQMMNSLEDLIKAHAYLEKAIQLVVEEQSDE